jgi:hypothetical protein
MTMLEERPAFTAEVEPVRQVDILYVSCNRLEFTIQSFEALIANTAWGRVRKLFIADDDSTDGTAEYLRDHWRYIPVPVALNEGRFGGPVAAMNWYLDETAEDPDAPDIWAKIDNDFVVCPGWLPEMYRQMELHHKLDILGTEPFLGDPAMPGTVHRDIEAPVAHIGGKGLIRRRAMQHSRPTPGGFNGYQGFTQWQEANEGVVKGWIKPDLPCFGLDQVRPEHGPWRGLAEEYARKGWQRLWPVYGDNAHYSWWRPVA